jgi:hypothetical protein
MPHGSTHHPVAHCPILAAIEGEGHVMGMDLIGLKPANKTGEYFYNTVWYWLPLWVYVAEECSDILNERDVTLGASNSGHRISRTKASAIGKRLDSLLRTGKTQAYAKRLTDRKLSRSKAPALSNVRTVAKALGVTAGRQAFTVENVRQFADFCVASGGFEIS